MCMFERKEPLVEPMLRLCRIFNTALDVMFYDVNVLTAALAAKGRTIEIGLPNLVSTAPPLDALDLTALTTRAGR